MGIFDAAKIGLGAILGIAIMLINNAFFHDPVVRAEARSGYVLEAQKTAAEARATELQRQITAGNLVIESYQEQLRNARAADAEKTAQTETEIADYERKLAEASRSCLLDSSDIEWLRK